MDQSQYEQSRYIGDIITSLIREAAHWKGAHDSILAENQKLKLILQQNANDKDQRSN